MKSILKATESITGKQEASLYVSTIGLEEQQKPIVRPHGLPVYQIFYCTAGSGELVVNEERYYIEAGNGFFLKAFIRNIWIDKIGCLQGFSRSEIYERIQAII